MSRTRAFTLIEVLAALTLVAMLMLVLMVVIGRMNDSIRRGEALEDDPRMADGRLINLLRHDLIHAQSVEGDGNDIVIVGYGGLDRVTHAATHGPVRITYRNCQTSADEAVPFLVREQVDLDDLTNRDASIELVGIGIRGFRIDGIGTDDAGPGDTGEGGRIGPPPLPVRFEVTWRRSVGSGDRETTAIVDRI